MNRLQIDGYIKYGTGVLLQQFGKVIGSLDKQARGLKLQSEGWHLMSLGDIEALAKAYLYDKEMAKRREVWVNGGG